MKSKRNWKIQYWRFIAVTHNLAEVWVAHITLEKNVISGFLHLGYKTSITTFSGIQKLRYVGGTSGFNTAEKPVVHSRYHRFLKLCDM